MTIPYKMSAGIYDLVMLVRKMIEDCQDESKVAGYKWQYTRALNSISTSLKEAQLDVENQLPDKIVVKESS